MRKIWIVYRPPMGFDDSPRNLVATLNEADAQGVAQRFNDFMERLRVRLAKLPDPFEDGISDEEHSERWDRRQGIVDRTRWPLGICLEGDISYGGTVVAAVMQLKAYEGKTPAHKTFSGKTITSVVIDEGVPS